MLEWLDVDAERASHKFEEIRSKVVKILVRRQCYEAEEVWDHTVNRVCHLLPTVVETYVGEPALYFYGVMRLVHLEWLTDEKRKRERLHDGPPPSPPSGEDLERLHECLDDCLQELAEEDRRLVLEYFGKDKREKIQHRRGMAKEQGITLNTLRMQVHRVNRKLEKCIDDSLASHKRL